MAEDEGFEPPQTESESGVLPLHKSSVCRVYYMHFCENVKDFFFFFYFFSLPLPGEGFSGENLFP